MSNTQPHITNAGAASAESNASRWLMLSGFALYAVAAPHSIAGAWAGIVLAMIGVVFESIARRQVPFRRTPFDVPLLLFYLWTILSLILSEEPRTSLAKLNSISTFAFLYLTAGALRREWIAPLAMLMILSGVAGVGWSASELARGRGVIVESLSADSPLRQTSPPIEAGACIWRVNEQRVSSIAEIDAEIRRAAIDSPLRLSVIAGGEHVEWLGGIVTNEIKGRLSPSGMTGTLASHRFRASGWTRHYETFAEVLQILAGWSLGFCLAYLIGRASRVRVWLFGLAFLILGLGIALTAMRTTLVALGVSTIVICWRAFAQSRIRLAALLVVAALLLSFGAWSVGRTRSAGALSLRDDSSSLRLQVARAAVERIGLHPLFGHGMDAVKEHWTEWNFPGTVMIHTHSTPIQLAFDRGVPALLFWLWLVTSVWLTTARLEEHLSTSLDTTDANAHGFLLGTIGSLAGFLASSFVNYNFGDSEVALLLWWTIGAVAIFARSQSASAKLPNFNR